ncbi:MAG TPA: hypothetical protein VGC42_07265 [Kofleriaceae bacterium]
MTTGFSSVIGDTLRQIAGLRSPVVRTCHVGNNTANNWGWLALARNTLLLQYDHTLYGVDDVCLPWLVLGDRGRVEADFDVAGRPRPEHHGLHATAALRAAPGRHHSVLCHGIFTDGGDVLHDHWRQAVRGSQRRNARAPSCDSADYLASFELLAALVTAFAERRQLHLIFDRWVRTSKRGVPVFFPIEHIAYGDRALTIHGGGGSLLHDAGIDALLAELRHGLAAVADRVRAGIRPPPLNYPWPALAFGYLWTAVKEHHADATQDRFFHAGGSASQYYLREPALAGRLQLVKRALVELGYLPEAAAIEVIPSHTCQLFATTPASAEVLAGMLEGWRDRLRRRDDTPGMLAQLSATTAPAVVIGAWFARLEPETRTWLAAQRTAFNRLDPHRLPIAHMTRPPADTYNKYGISQRALAERPVIFPEVFHHLRWFEAELLAKALAEVACHEPELAERAP